MYHNKDKDYLIVSVSESLKEIYDEYSSRGMLAVYIWGSILTPDFNPESSDIDTIAIVDDGIDRNFEEKIQKELTSRHPEIKKLGFRLLYKSEFDTGVSKGALGSIGNPALLLLDLPTWHWVCGTQFTQKDFGLPVPTYSQAIKLRYENTNERWPNIDLINSEEVQYFVKQILRIVHLKQLQKENLPYTMFSYSSIREVADGKPEAEVVNICLSIKAAKWDFELFKNNIHIFKQYISDLKLEVDKIMNEDQYLNILISYEPIFEQAAKLACDLRNKVSSYNKSQTGDEILDIVTEADLQVQEFILSRLAETPLIECKLIAEESTPSVSRFKGTNGLVLSLDPIDGTAMYVAGQGFFSLIIGMHNKKDILYTYYRYPLLNWTKRIVRNRAEDIGNLPEVKIRPGIESISKIAYLAHVKPEQLPSDIEEKLSSRGLSVCDRKDISDEATMTALLYLEKIAGVCVQNPIAYDCLGLLHYARSTEGFEIYSTVDLTKPTKGQFGMYYPGLYVVWKK